MVYEKILNKYEMKQFTIKKFIQNKIGVCVLRGRKLALISAPKITTMISVIAVKQIAESDWELKVYDY